MSQFTETMFRNARFSVNAMVTGEPTAPVCRPWIEVHETARRIAGGLAAAGVGHGDAVAVLAGEPAEIAPTAQACWMRGASLTMLHQPTPRTDLTRWINETADVLGVIAAKTVVVGEPFTTAGLILNARGLRAEHVASLSAHSPTHPVPTIDDDIALMQLTSGSTGSPKVVHITHANVLANAEAMIVGCRFDVATDVIVSWLPCFHDMGMTGYLTVPMLFGAQLVKFTPAEFMRDILLWPRLIDKYRGTMTAAPNFAYALLARRLRVHSRPGDFNLGSLRWVLSGAEQVNPMDVQNFCDAARPFGFTQTAMVPAYGMAETTVAVSFSECSRGMKVDEVDATLLSTTRIAMPSADGPTRALAVLGKPLPGLDVRVVDSERKALPPRRVGVIHVRGDAVTNGYRTADGFVDIRDGDGWYDTGDLGYLTSDGEIVVCGRLKDVIVVGGRNIYPADVERAACRVSGVRQGCSAAVRLDAGATRETFAVVVESKQFEDEDDVRRIEHAVAHEVLAEVDARPRRVVVVAPGAIPKTPSGKLRRTDAEDLIVQT